MRHSPYDKNNSSPDRRTFREFPELHRSLDENPCSVDLLLERGIHSARLGDLLTSIDYFRKALEIAPDSPGLHSNLGLSLQKCGRLSEAIECFRKALELEPSLSAAWHNLGNALNELGLVENGSDAYRCCLANAPDDAAARSDFLLSLNYRQDVSPEYVYEEHREWARRHGLGRDRMPEAPAIWKMSGARLRIGYLSPNFCRHSVAYFIEPLLEHHDRSNFHVFAYADVYAGDRITQRLAGKVESWRDVSTLEIDQLASQIRQDKISVLVDLAGHTSFRQMLLMSMRLAPVQVTYLGYPNTTGLDTVDFRLTDEVADPEKLSDCYASERLIRIPGGFLCYRPPDSDEVPDPSDAPCLSRGFITFGSFNNLNKISPMIMELWAKILLAVPESRLHLKARQLADTAAKARIVDGFEQFGVEPDRISVFQWAGSQHEHLSKYNEIDIALDTFPYNGTTTTCEALWMGVPVVTLSGKNHVSRVSLSLLHQCGLEELATATPDEYLQTAVALATDRERIQGYHSSLRGMLSASALVDAKGFCRRLESIYRNMVNSSVGAAGAKDS